MSPVAHKIIDMVDMLPEEEQKLAYELIKRLVLAWDPDFTKLTEKEMKSLEEAEIELDSGEFVALEDIKWS